MIHVSLFDCRHIKSDRNDEPLLSFISICKIVVI